MLKGKGLELLRPDLLFRRAYYFCSSFMVAVLISAGGSVPLGSSGLRFKPQYSLLYVPSMTFTEMAPRLSDSRVGEISLLSLYSPPHYFKVSQVSF